MIVYEDSKRSFVEDVKTNCIADKIADKIREHGINAGQEREYISWQNSLQFMRNVVDDREIDDDVSRIRPERVHLQAQWPHSAPPFWSLPSETSSACSKAVVAMFSCRGVRAVPVCWW